MKIIAYNHTHWDREWYKTFQDYRLRFAEVMDLIISEIRNDNIDCFYLDGQTIILEDYFELYPENRPLIKELISKNKIIIGPWYALADEFLVSGESLFRNILIGINQAKELGCDRFIGYLPDSFGHNSEIPRILSAFGINNAVLWRGAGSNSSEFLWKSEDNSSVLATYLIEGYFQNFLHYDISIEEKAAKLKEFLEKIKEFSSSEYILLPIGGDHLGPVIGLKGQLEEIGKMLEGYTFEQGGIFDYIEKIGDITNLTEAKEELRDNSRNPILPGTLSTRTYLKQANAISSWKLSKLAEPFYTLACHAGFISPRNNELKYAWKMLIKNHPHDSICGCSIDEVHDEMMPRFAQVNQISDGLILRAQNAVSSRVNKNSIWVYNASDFEFSGVVKLKTNGELSENLQHQLVKSSREFPKEILLDTQRPPFSEDIEEFKEYLVYVENIAPHSIKIIDECFKYSKQPDFVEINKKRIGNSRIKIDVNSDGALKLTDIGTGKVFDGLHYLYDRADIGDTYNYSPVKNDRPLKSKFIKSEIIENGKLRSTLRLYYELDIPACFDEKLDSRSRERNKTVITTDISLTCGSRRAEFVSSWENKSKDHILQIKFRFDKPVENTFAENTFGIINRKFDPDYSLKEFIPAQKGTELKTNTAPMQRFVWADGISVITEGLSEYGVSKNELYITALRSVGKLSKLALNTRNFPAGPPLDTEGAQCSGIQSVRYALCAVDNPVELFKEADEFFGSIISDVGSFCDCDNTSLREEAAASTKQSQHCDCFSTLAMTNLLTFIKISNENIYTYAVKNPENGEGVVFRMMNLSGKPQNVTLKTDLGFSSYTEVNGLEESISNSVSFNKELAFKPFEMKSVLFK